MGPNCQLKSLLASEEDTSQSNHERFSKMNSLAEERKVNLFYLKDTLLNKETNMHEKMEALSQIRKNATLPVFKFAIESLIANFK